MDHALAMGLVERVGNLNAVSERIGQGQRTPRETLRQRFALEVLHHQEVQVAVVRASLSDVEYGADVRMAESGKRLGLPLEPLLQRGVRRHVRRQDLDRDRPIQTSVVGLVDLAHPTCPEGPEDVVDAESGCPPEATYGLFVMPRSSGASVNRRICRRMIRDGAGQQRWLQKFVGPSWSTNVRHGMQRHRPRCLCRATLHVFHDHMGLSTDGWETNEALPQAVPVTPSDYDMLDGLSAGPR